MSNRWCRAHFLPVRHPWKFTKRIVSSIKYVFVVGGTYSITRWTSSFMDTRYHVAERIAGGASYRNHPVWFEHD